MSTTQIHTAKLMYCLYTFNLEKVKSFKDWKFPGLEMQAFEDPGWKCFPRRKRILFLQPN